MKKALSLIVLALLVGYGYPAAAQHSRGASMSRGGGMSRGYAARSYGGYGHYGNRGWSSTGRAFPAPLFRYWPRSYYQGRSFVSAPGAYSYGSYANGAYPAAPTLPMPTSGTLSTSADPYQYPVWVTTPVIVNGGPLAPVTAQEAQAEATPAATGAGPGPASATRASQATATSKAVTRLSAVEERLAKAEGKIHALAELSRRGVTVNEAWCKGFLKNPKAPGLEPTDAESAQTTCREILGEPAAADKK